MELLCISSSVSRFSSRRSSSDRAAACRTAAKSRARASKSISAQVLLSISFIHTYLLGDVSRSCPSRIAAFQGAKGNSRENPPQAGSPAQVLLSISFITTIPPFPAPQRELAKNAPFLRKVLFLFFLERKKQRTAGAPAEQVAPWSGGLGRAYAGR